MNLNKYLSKEHLAAGITLTDDEHFVYLRQNGSFKTTWSALADIPIAVVIHEADQILNWSMSGVSFEKE